MSTPSESVAPSGHWDPRADPRELRERLREMEELLEQLNGKREPTPKIPRSKEQQERVRAKLYQDEHGFWHDLDGFASRETVEAAGIVWWTELPEVKERGLAGLSRRAMRTLASPTDSASTNAAGAEDPSSRSTAQR
uniref:Uncharacterized protein n=1 Tax=Neobodo designis TaxID=312471 RepID=A0A7S1R6F1_NEODS|mmetsp:Transcript_9256/g.28699  ORF Transcript_9256/g.28699 Transcript_9256/m.28699 type:complete len:137 (+) Transcript_9256:114-524(+)|eukprot:CAMPEP_0174836066 /NCGR_PEP_ID=MMETSP1114-20130205/5802_1 /TAXON_ID=312471 /ORGANISM="Neobodo designis, Strain CCAP 1951/1" /LENGTH=136 /DNA_ID=CAMNT_0016070031 /DNA_START=177 /DNA_END=587 /DNA_ORIENTATION=+